MAITAIIKLTEIGVGIDNFEIRQSSDNFATVLAGHDNVTRAALLDVGGYTITNIDDSSFTLRIQSITPGCTNYIDRSIGSSGRYQLTASQTGNLRVSDDYGQTWADTVPAIPTSNSWWDFAMSASGQYQGAAGQPGFLKISSDYGVNWVDTGTSDDWFRLEISGTGEFMIATKNGVGYIWVSIDYGATWNQRSLYKTYGDVAISSSGETMVALNNNDGSIDVSTDFGNVWIPNGVESGSGVDMSSSGQIIMVVGSVAGGRRSIDGGANWLDMPPLAGYLRVAVSSDGIYAIAVGTGKYAISDDSGATWTESTQFATNFEGVTISSTGQFMAMVGVFADDFIYESIDYGQTWATKDGDVGRRSIVMNKI